MSEEIVKLNLSLARSSTTVDGALPKAPRLPKGVYGFRVKAPLEATESKAGEPMFTALVEIIAPESITLDDVEYDIVGKEFTHYISMKDSLAGRMLAQFHAACELPLEGVGLNPETNMPCSTSEDGSIEEIDYVGAEFSAIAASQESTQVDEDGNALVNPKTGKEMTSSYARLGQLLYDEDAS